MICEQSLSKTISFFSSSAHGNNDLRITVLEKKTVVASDEQCRQLQITAGSEMHFYSRLCRLGDTPAFIEHEYVSAERLPNLWEHDIA
jgi:DNA-binding GntR family transcriptional regulator